jgi:hexosaminidase
MIGWDEILHSGLPANTMIHVWHTAKPLTVAAQQGFGSILSSGFYINHSQPATVAYANDPLPADSILTPEQQRLIKGGEATMWTEWVTPETIDSRIWPHAAVVAERLWSPREVNDVPDLYRRLGVISRRLEEAGLEHEKNRPALMRRFVGDNASEADLAGLRTLCDYLAPTNGNVRYRLQPATVQSTPLTGLPDCLLSESLPAETYLEDVQQFVFAPGTRDSAAGEVLARRLAAWSASVRGLLGPSATRSPRLHEIIPFVTACLDAADIGEEALHALVTGSPQTVAWRTERLARLAVPPLLPADLSLKPPIRLLVAAAGADRERATMTPAEWRNLIEKLATPH